MKKTAFLFLILISVFSGFAQNSTDPVLVKKEMGTMYIQKGRSLKPKQLLVVTQNNKEAYQLMEKASANYDFANGFGFAGGFMVGMSLGSLVARGEANWAIAGVGVGCIIASAPFSIRYHKQTKKAVEIYNQGLTQTGSNNIHFKLGTWGNGFAFSMLF